MFTSKCFIRKNTPELISKLIDLGYVKAFFDEEYAEGEVYGLILNNGDIEPLEHGIQEMELMFTYNFVDCGDNEELFIALAALRDDTDKNQRFVLHSHIGSINYPDSCIPAGSLMICDNETWDEVELVDAHKATVKELIEFFKKD